MLLDVFSADAFKLLPLSQAVTLLPHTPTQLRAMGLFNESGIRTTEIGIEMVAGVLTLVPAQPRGGPAVVKGLPGRNVRKLSAVHLPQRTALLADEVMGLRAFGTESDEEVAMQRLMEKLAVCRRDNDLTIEWQRMGAIKGKVIDADGTTVLMNLFTEFGVSQQTFDMALDVSGTKVRSKCTQIKRLIDSALGGVTYTDVDVLCDATFFDDFVDHGAVAAAYTGYQQGQGQLTSDLRKGFRFGEMNFVEYRGQVGATKFIETGCAYAVPRGVPGMFETYYAPANAMDAVGRPGLPYYASLEPMDHDAGIDALVQSNPLHVVNRPNAIIKLGRNAAALA